MSQMSLDELETKYLVALMRRDAVIWARHQRETSSAAAATTPRKQSPARQKANTREATPKATSPAHI
jgi:hypothetical protein